jgi:hypothetical protein
VDSERLTTLQTFVIGALTVCDGLLHYTSLLRTQTKTANTVLAVFALDFRLLIVSSVVGKSDLIICRVKQVQIKLDLLSCHHNPTEIPYEVVIFFLLFFILGGCRP